MRRGLNPASSFIPRANVGSPRKRKSEMSLPMLMAGIVRRAKFIITPQTTCEGLIDVVSAFDSLVVSARGIAMEG
jgi:hypothetical protein